jgi:hypothetical protein
MFYQREYPMATQRTMDFFLHGALEFGQKVQELGLLFSFWMENRQLVCRDSWKREP